MHLIFSRVVFGLFFILNLVLWIEGSSAAIPFTTLLALLALWFGISVPLTFVGAYFGFKKRVGILFICTVFKLPNKVEKMMHHYKYVSTVSEVDMYECIQYSLYLHFVSF